MLFTNYNHTDLPPLLFHDIIIQRISSVRFLGVELDDKLKFDLHINNVCSKISKNIGIISRLSYSIPKFVLKNLYNCLIEPYLYYCSLIFGGAYDLSP